MLRELAEIIVRPLSIVFEKSWRSGDILGDWKRPNSTPIYKKCLKDDPRNYSPINLPSVPGKVMEEILLRTVTSQIKQVIWKSQHTYNKGQIMLDKPAGLL